MGTTSGHAQPAASARQARHSGWHVSMSVGGGFEDCAEGWAAARHVVMRLSTPAAPRKPAAKEEPYE